MNGRRLHSVLLASLTAATLLIAAAANAGLFRSYLSQNGNDANPCTVNQPCRLLPAALSAVNDGGEIWIVDSANYNTAPVNINKSVTILAIPGALGSIVASGGDAIDIATANVRVTLRNLVILNFSGGFNGINYSQGAQLTVEGCEIYNMPEDGIHVSASPGVLIVKDTTIHDGGGSGIFIVGSLPNGITATIEHTRLFGFTNNGLGVASTANVSLVASLVANATFGVAVLESGGGGSRVTIDNSTIRAASTGVSLNSPTASDAVRVTISRTLITSNDTGIDVQSASGNARVTLDNDVIQHQTTAININGGIVWTRGNNTMNFFTNGVVGGTLTSLAGV